LDGATVATRMNAMRCKRNYGHARDDENCYRPERPMQSAMVNVRESFSTYLTYLIM
jgi:hypothetical protein